MNLDVSAIVNAKISALQASGIVEAQIEKSVEKTVLDAISSALESYDFRREISERVKKSISGVASEIGLSAYNGFISEKIKEITEGAMRKDLSDKIQRQIDGLLIVKHDGIKLSEIFAAYRNYLMENTDDDEKVSRGSYTADLSERRDGNFRFYNIKLSEERLDEHDSADILIRFCIYGENKTSAISNLFFSGSGMDKCIKIGTLNEVEALLANLYYNKTEIVMDVDDVDASNEYDTDDY